MVFGSTANSIRRIRLVRRDPVTAMRENLRRQLPRRTEAFDERDERLGHRVPHRIGTRHHGSFGHGVMLNQHAFELERAHSVVRRLEHVVGPPDERQVPSASRDAMSPVW